LAAHSQTAVPVNMGFKPRSVAKDILIRYV
jgi:hypothetical protein